MKKLRAFTLLELLFVMILSTIVLGIGYLSFIITLKQLYSYKEGSKKITEAFQLTTLLNKDFTESKSVRKSDDALIFTDALNNPLKYFFSEEYVVRNMNSVVDTFFYGIQNRSEKFLDKPADSNNGLVDEIFFEIKIDDEQFEIFHAVKSYSVDILMQQETLNSNNF